MRYWRAVIVSVTLDLLWGWLRYLDNRRKHKPLSDPWQRIWMRFVYDSHYGHSTLTGDPDGNFDLAWHGPMPWERP